MISTDLLVIIILTAACFVLFVMVAALKIKNNKFINSIAQLVIDKSFMSDEIDKLSFLIDNGPTIENDFIKFLSESRTSAYDYIEQVQVSIQNLKDAMDSDSEDLIDQRYKELLKFLPSKNLDVVE